MSIVNNEVDEFVYEQDKESFTGDNNIKITCDDTNKKINVSLNKDFVNKVNNSLSINDLDNKSIIKAPSNNKYYTEALSKPSSKKYWNIDEIAHLPESNTDASLKKFISGEYNNNLKIDSKGLLKAETPHYKQILTEKDGKFTNGVWTFHHSLLQNTKYYFVIDGEKMVDFVRPYQLELATVPFKIPSLVQTFQIVSIDGSIKGSIKFSIDENDGSIIIESSLLTANDNISIYEWETKLFYSLAGRGW